MYEPAIKKKGGGVHSRNNKPLARIFVNKVDVASRNKTFNAAPLPVPGIKSFFIILNVGGGKKEEGGRKENNEKLLFVV